MTRKIYAIYKDGVIKEMKTTVKADTVYDATVWLVEHVDELKSEARNLGHWGSPVLGFNLSGKVSDSLRKKIVKPTEL